MESSEEQLSYSSYSVILSVVIPLVFITLYFVSWSFIYLEELFLMVPFTLLLAVLTAIDIRRRVVPHGYLLAAVVWWVLLSVIYPDAGWGEQLFSATVASLAIFATALISSGGVGMGDVKLVFVMGLYLGWNVLPALLISFVIAALVGLLLALKLGKNARKLTIPFVPYLAIGGVVAMLFGDLLVNYYVGLL